MANKKYLGMSVLDASRERIAWTFETFPKIYLSFSGGKDSTVMMHLVMDEAIKRDRKVGVMFMDLEGQYTLTIDHIQHMFDLYADHIEPYWICAPLLLRNAVTQFEQRWIAWDADKKEAWIRQPPKIAITDMAIFPFARYGMEFEEFVPEFGHWYGGNELTACFVGIRTGESLNRWRTIAGHGNKFIESEKPLNWTNWIGKTLYNVYPIYDWHEKDIWAYHGKFFKPYNKLYDYMHKAGLTLHQMRICQPYGDDQRKGLWLFHIIEPQTWSKIVARVNGANSGALYAQESGNILGNLKVSKPEGHTWESFVKLLLDSMPHKTSEHFKNKIAVFLYYWKNNGYPDGIPDEMPRKDEAARNVPSWRRVCKSILRFDYWCKGLSFSQTKSTSYSKYLKLMKKRRESWRVI